MCLGAVVVLRVKTRDPPAEVAMVLSLDTSCFVACSRIFVVRARSRPRAGSLDAESMPRMTLCPKWPLQTRAGVVRSIWCWFQQFRSRFC
ncbi:hypothetical protein CABS01_16756 [Colletotrichum abscissum]|uniref:uncharacterized protein n=1 Tax=Colletotrichum abscissum TaxID=1671311 RepID=UPI0027D5661A|nr:uncharacterized protein CABS01_16756 [Colletotrichum abscissum]KAK1514248.1 hypothetical protein CABS01_16756 [Colletotrichum abscissum]